MRKAFLLFQVRAYADYVKALVGSRRDRLKLYMNVHSYSQLVLTPWGFTKDPYEFQTEVMEIVKPVRALERREGTKTFRII